MKASAKKANLAVQPWDDRPGASAFCWGGMNLETGVTVPPPGSAENPATGDAAEYAYGRTIGRDCAIDYQGACAECIMDDTRLSNTVCNLMQDPTRSEIVKRGALAGFLEEMAKYTHRGIDEILYTKPAGAGRDYLALFGTRGLLFEIKDEHEAIAGHLAVLTKAHCALSRLSRIGAKSDEVLDEEAEDAADGLEFLSAMAAMLAKHAAVD